MTSSRAELDAMAREQGFPDYETWAGWHRKYRAQDRRGQVQQAEPEQKNFLQSLIDKIPIHPSYLLNYANDKLKGATKK